MIRNDDKESQTLNKLNVKKDIEQSEENNEEMNRSKTMKERK